MDQIKLQWFEDRLWKRYTELRAVEERLTGELGEPLTFATGELSAYDQHSADFGSETYERSKDLGLLENTRRQLEQIEAALKAIEEGTYGVCRSCGATIPEERLEAIPETDLCVECSRKTETGERERPVEEGILVPHLSRSFSEESWQAVEQYGTASGPPKQE